MDEERSFDLDKPESEYRFAELRAEADSREIYGLVAPYNVETTIGKMFREKILPGAFGDVGSLDSWMTRQHKRELVLGRTGRNVFLTDSPEGLQMRAIMPKTPLGEDTLYLIREGILTGISVEFQPRRVRWEPGVVPLRNMVKSGLRRFSIVDLPEYETTLVHAREKAYFDELTGKSVAGGPNIHTVKRNWDY